MVLTGAEHRDVLDEDQLLVMLVEGLLQHGVRIGIEAGENLLVGPGDSGRRVAEPVAVRVLADRDQQLAYGCFGTGPVHRRSSVR
jgi:hypothetical protein